VSQREREREREREPRAVGDQEMKRGKERGKKRADEIPSRRPF
jgi:hypothetical protein